MSVRKMWKTNFDPAVPVERVVLNVGEYRYPWGSERRVGDVAIPSHIEANFPPPRDGWGLLVTVEIVDGAPGCTGVEIYTQDGGKYVRPKDLEWLRNNLDNIVASMVRETSKFVDEDGGVTYYVQGSAGSRDERARVNMALTGAMKGSRRRQTDMHLARIVEAYRGAENGRDAVRRAFPHPDGTFVDMRTVDRWIKSARERGMFEPSGEPQAPLDMSLEAQTARADAALDAMNPRVEG